MRSAASPTRTSTCSSSAAASPEPASRSTPRRAACASALVDKGDFASGTSSKSSKLVHGGIRYLQQKEVGLVYEALAERQIAAQDRAAPRARAAVPAPGVHARRAAPGQARAHPRRDDVGVRPHRRPAHRQAAQARLEGRSAARTCRRCPPTGSPRRTSTTTRRPTTRGSRSRSRAPRPTTAPRSRTTRRSSASTRTRAGHVHVGARRAADAEIRGPRPQRRERDRRVGRRRARLDEGTHPDTIRPAKGIHITVPWALVRNQIAVVVPVPKDRRSVFVVPWGERGNGEFAFTYIGTTDTDYDGPLDDPQCTPDDIAYLLRAINASVDDHDHRGRRARHVGRPAAARRATRGANAPPTSAGGTRCASPTAASSRSPAASSRRTGGWPPTPSTRSMELLDRERPQPHQGT